jgi:hypothetical protein
MGIGFLQGVERSGRDVDRPILSCTEVKERIKLYLYSLLGLRGLFWGELYLLLLLLLLSYRAVSKFVPDAPQP